MEKMLKLGHQLLEAKCCRCHHQIDAISRTALENTASIPPPEKSTRLPPTL